MRTHADSSATRQAAPADATRVLLRLAPGKIVELHAFIEGYDDLAVLRTVDAAAGLVEVYVSPGSEGEFEELRRALCREGLPSTLAGGER